MRKARLKRNLHHTFFALKQTKTRAFHASLEYKSMDRYTDRLLE